VENTYIVYEFDTFDKSKKHPLECDDYQMAKEFAYVIANEYCTFKKPSFIDNLCIGDSNIGALIELKFQ